MTQIILYTGGGVTLSPVYAEGRTESQYVRLVADDGKILQHGDVMTPCIDVNRNDIGDWQEVDAPIIEDEPDPTELLSILLGGDGE